jgi:hypothetical protein
MRRNLIAWMTVLATVALLAACGGDSDEEPTSDPRPPVGAAPGTATASASESSATTEALVATRAATEPVIPTEAVAATETTGESDEPDGDANGLVPCELLTADDVATVLPDADDGFEAMAGGSLIDGVDAYQCSYMNPVFDLFTVIVNVAEDDERFEWIEPSPSAYGDEAREVDVADGGWLHGTDTDLKVTVVKGLAVIDLELMAAYAGERADALIELARIVADRLE